jgi:hypothetical protein
LIIGRARKDVFITASSVVDYITDVCATEVGYITNRAVSVWCKRFSVNFGAAALTPAQVSGLE